MIRAGERAFRTLRHVHADSFKGGHSVWYAFLPLRLCGLGRHGRFSASSCHLRSPGFHTVCGYAAVSVLTDGFHATSALPVHTHMRFTVRYILLHLPFVLRRLYRCAGCHRFLEGGHTCLRSGAAALPPSTFAVRLSGILTAVCTFSRRAHSVLRLCIFWLRTTCFERWYG